MTSHINLLDAALDDSESFWRDYGETDVYAMSLANKLRPDEWQALDAIWRQRPLEWQRCLATVLAFVSPKVAVAWLFEMIERGEDELAMHAIDELRDMQNERSLILPWPKPVLRRVSVLWARHRGFTAQQREQLLDDMARGRLRSS